MTTAEHIEQRPITRPVAERWLCCSCHAVLGEITGKTVNIRIGTRHKGRREITAYLPCSQRCEGCGALNVREG